VSNHIRRLRAATLIAAIAIALVSDAHASTPKSVVEEFHTRLIGIMRDADSLGFEGRCDRLEAAMGELFDIPFMAQKSVGRYWKATTPEERTELLNTFERFTVSNYAGNFDAYDGEAFETQDVVDSTHGTKLVRTRLLASDGEVVQLNYRLRQVDGSWKIVDVYLNGTVSELALRRSEYSALIKREGFDSLIVALNEKIADLANGAAPAERSP